ncbi:MAG: Gfo/Idh/MocA family oxidoreductase [Candidatus Beckwithbacteria bacterium]|nr:Gfo/Idh/MocA family oxidoreductase [Patescibacteria group bacterium]
MKFVIVGLGSIGKRHQKNLEVLGHEVVPCHQDDNLEQILDKNKPDGVLICNPTSLHIPTAIVVANAGYPMFLEKPVSHNLKGLDKLIQIIKQKSLMVQVGYNLRFEPELMKIKQQLVGKQFGRVYSARIVAGSYFPDWRSNIDYKQNYGARLDLGGGVILDLSHEIDYAVWLFGKANKVSAMIKKAPELEIETEAIGQLNIEFDSGVIAQIQVDYLSRKYRRNMEIVTEKKTVYWDYAELKEKGWNSNEMFINELKHFINAIKSEIKPTPTIDEGKYVLEIIEAAKKSNKSGRMIKL